MGSRSLSSWRLPRWALLVMGILCTLLGGVIAFKPFASLSVLIAGLVAGALLKGVTDLAAAGRSPNPRLAALTGVLWMALAIVILAWPDATIRTVAVLVGLGMVADGVARVFAGVRGRADERFTSIIFGVANLVFGLLALSWPDVRILIVALFFGVQLALFGLTRILDAVRGERAAAAPGPTGGTLGRWSRGIGAVVTLAIALILLGASAVVHRGEPVADAFYDAPDDLPAEPGVLLRTEPFTNSVPEGARAWRILYTTTRDEGVPAVASAIVVAGTDLPDGPRPVVAWAHGTTGFARNCAPSVLDDPFSAGAMPALDQVVANGWILVATDYVGLGTEGPHPYLIGQPAGRSVLDSVRAAKELEELDLKEQTVVWGHSQGGHAALWTGILATGYAPDVNVIGVAALAPASDLPGLAGNLDIVTGGALFGSFVIAGYSETYDDVAYSEYVKWPARVVMREMADRCLAEPATFVSIVVTLLFDQSPWAMDPNTGALGERLKQNIPDGAIEAPVLLAQGETDALVLPSPQEAYVDARCADGATLEYRTYPGRDHVGVVAADSPLIPDLIGWTEDRLAGAQPVSTCGG